MRKNQATWVMVIVGLGFIIWGLGGYFCDPSSVAFSFWGRTTGSGWFNAACETVNIFLPFGE